MEGKKVKDTSVIMSHVVMSQDANVAGNVHGGVIMKHIDTAAGVVASRHARCNAVTASIDKLDFHNPAFIGELLTLTASLNLVGKTSMEIGVRVEAENTFTAEKRHIASAYLTFVALDEKHQPKEVPPLILEDADEIRRNQEAIERRKIRLFAKGKRMET
ncbi:MAG: acyl-CoA thioesterase [Deltaproteobacteria bacterium RBG_13_52_11]|nr:MAG: acyl-CoA thioesterase [Deltaproteobacteria bacterium RBG_13_52_11]